MIRVPSLPPIVRWSENFDALTSIINFGAWPEQYPGPQTAVCLCFPTGAGEAGTNTMFAVTPSASNDGMRMLSSDGGGIPNLQFHGSSTGSAGNPLRASNSSTITYNAWNFCAATWDGTLIATGIRLFNGINGVAVAELGYSSATNGTTAVKTGTGNPLTIGNRGDAGRTFAGNIAYTARFSRILTLEELGRVQRQGPLAFYSDLIFCYANRIDYGPYGRQPVSRVATPLRAPPVIYAPLGLLPVRRLFPYTAAAAFNAAWATSANTVIHSGALTA